MWQLHKDAWSELDWAAIGTALMDAIAMAAGVVWDLLVAIGFCHVAAAQGRLGRA